MPEDTQEQNQTGEVAPVSEQPIPVATEVAAEPAPTGNESPFQDEGEPGPGSNEPIPAAAEPAPNSSPNDSGTSEPSAAAPAVAEAPAAEPSSEPKAPPAPVVEEQPAPTLSAPTVQPPLPVSVFAEHGAPTMAAASKVKTGIYVDTEGVEHKVQIVAERKDGSVDIMMPATVGGYRRDGVRRKQDADQTTDFIK